MAVRVRQLPARSRGAIIVAHLIFDAVIRLTRMMVTLAQPTLPGLEKNIRDANGPDQSAGSR